MHPAYAKVVGRMAYVWGCPMVNMINRRAAITQAPEPGRLNGVLPVAPRGKVGMLADYIDPDDKAMYEKLATLGIKAGADWNPAKLSPEIRQALQQGIDDARAQLKKLSEGKIDAAKFFNTREIVGTNYVDRALGVYMGIFGNVTQQSVYLSMPADAEGKPLDGAKSSYTLAFTKDQMPPVKYFWSITMYNLPQHLLVDNPIYRYSIGSSTPDLKTNSDGSLTIYVSAKSPGKDKDSNWLLAPDGPFWTVMRTYGPDESIISGAYQRPDYVAQNK